MFAKRLRRVATRLLQCVGYREPTDAAIEAAMAAHDDFVERIEEIRAQHDPEYEEDQAPGFSSVIAKNP
jgi:hypothetical protein